ncbi:MAG: hypothetical protein N3D12_06605 [Candidatus Methanomethyliaceae archaeon]|nr:hypothetical protein [Candidatus Methanomethyliaceae archaeon]
MEKDPITLTPIEASLLLLIRLSEKKEFSAREIWSEIPDKVSLVTVIKALERLEQKGYLEIERSKRRGQSLKIRPTDKALLYSPMESLYNESLVCVVLGIESISKIIRKDLSSIPFIICNKYLFLPLFRSYESLKLFYEDSDPIDKIKSSFFALEVFEQRANTIAFSIFDAFFFDLSKLVYALDDKIIVDFLALSSDQIKERTIEICNGVRDELLKLLEVFKKEEKLLIQRPSVFQDWAIDALQKREGRNKLIVNFILGGKDPTFLKRAGNDKRELEEYLSIFKS